MLYHYTSIEKLKNILETQKLWMTKISDFKDDCEFYHAISMVSKELSMSRADSFKLFSEVKKHNSNIYVGCFCSDNDSLFLWKNYGGLRGVNIEFSKKELMSLVHYQQRSFGYISANSNFLSCEYHRVRQEAIIKGALKQWGKRK